MSGLRPNQSGKPNIVELTTWECQTFSIYAMSPRKDQGVNCSWRVLIHCLTFLASSWGVKLKFCCKYWVSLINFITLDLPDPLDLPRPVWPVQTRLARFFTRTAPEPWNLDRVQTWPVPEPPKTLDPCTPIHASIINYLWYLWQDLGNVISYRLFKSWK